MLQHPSIFTDVANCITWSCKRNSVKKEKGPAPPAPPTPPQVPPPHPTPPHTRSCPCPCPCPGSGPGPSLTQSLPYPRAVQFWKAMFSRLHKTDSRIETNQKMIFWKTYVKGIQSCIELQCQWKDAEKTKGPSTPGPTSCPGPAIFHVHVLSRWQSQSLIWLFAWFGVCQDTHTQGWISFLVDNTCLSFTFTIVHGTVGIYVVHV